MKMKNPNEQPGILQRLKSGEVIPMSDPMYSEVRYTVDRTFQLLARLNSATHTDEVRALLSEVLRQPVEESTTVFPPFHTNYGRNIELGKRVFINHACSFFDLGGIIIEDDVMIGPRVNITSENHPVEAKNRKALVPGPVRIQCNAWIGAGATILPRLTVGENAVVAAGAVVHEDVPANTVFGGVPAKLIKPIKS